VFSDNQKGLWQANLNQGKEKIAMMFRIRIWGRSIHDFEPWEGFVTAESEEDAARKLELTKEGDHTYRCAGGKSLHVVLSPEEETSAEQLRAACAP